MERGFFVHTPMGVSGITDELTPAASEPGAEAIRLYTVLRRAGSWARYGGMSRIEGSCISRALIDLLVEF
jgi:hypothetical protein